MVYDVRQYNAEECQLALESALRERNRHFRGSSMWELYENSLATIEARLAELRGAPVHWSA